MGPFVRYSILRLTLLVAVGVQVFTIVTIWFLVPKLASATERYGLAGIAATMLFWLYVLGRLFIAAATLNACAAALHDGGVRIVSFVTFGRAPALGDRW